MSLYTSWSMGLQVGIPGEDDWVGAEAGASETQHLIAESTWVSAQGFKTPCGIHWWRLRHSVLCQPCASSLPFQHLDNSGGWHCTQSIKVSILDYLSEKFTDLLITPSGHGIVNGSQIQNNIHCKRKGRVNQGPYQRWRQCCEGTAESAALQPHEAQTVSEPTKKTVGGFFHRATISYTLHAD